VPTYFVSGHLELSPAEFADHYEPQLRAALAEGAAFVVGDARGCDALTQAFLDREGCTAVLVFHMFDAPRHNAGFPTVGGFASDADRDAAMTQRSDADIGWVRPGREKSGTARNLARRSK